MTEETETTKTPLATSHRTDQMGAAAGALLAISGVIGLEERLGLTGDDLAILLGGLFTLAGIVRAELIKRSAKDA